MPHLSSIRLVNTYFNNATQFYDDFKMDLGGKDATYDLENGGGKSLLLLMILQTVLPKSYLRKEKPISLLFQGGKDRTSHVVVEWILDEGSQYKYILTGFCARKKKGTVDRETNEEDENILAGDIEHLNWCVFYNDNKITSIKSAPLFREEAGKKTYSSFDEIRKYIQQMKQKGLPAEVFDGIEKYQRYISAHNLIPAEWNIIRGINSGENNIESYFRQNATSRKLIENQFVKIIEDVEALNRREQGNDESYLLADTLIEIRNRLDEYLRLKEHIEEFEKIKEYYNEFEKRNEDLLNRFTEYEAFKLQAVGIRNFIEAKLKELATEEIEILKKIEYSTASYKEGIILKKLLEAGLIKYRIVKRNVENEKLEAAKNMMISEKQDLKNKYFELMALEGYGEYRKIKRKLYEAEQNLVTIKNDEDDINYQYRNTGGKLKYLLIKELSEGNLIKDNHRDILEKLEENKKANQEILIVEEKRETALNVVIEPLEEDEKQLSEKVNLLQSFFLEQGQMDALINPSDFLNKTEKMLKQYETQHHLTLDRIELINDRKHSLQLEEVEISGDIKQWIEAKKSDEKWLNTYKVELKELETSASNFGKNNLEEYKEGLELLLHRENISKVEQEIEMGRLKQKKQLSEQRGYYVPNEEILSFTEQLSKKCEYIKAGIDWIAETEISKREMLLEEMPFLPFSVIVDRKSFEKLKDDRIKLNFDSDYPIPVVNVETIRNMKDPSKEGIFYFCSFADLILEHSEYEQYMENINSKMHSITKDISERESRIQKLNVDLRKLIYFLENYSKDKIDKALDDVEKMDREIKKLDNKKVEIYKEKEQLINEQNDSKKKVDELAQLIQGTSEKAEKLKDLIQSKEKLESIRKKISRDKKDRESIRNTIKNIRDEATKLEQKYQSTQNELKGIEIKLHDLNKEKESLQSFEEVENKGFPEEVRAQYQALLNIVSGRMEDESKLRDEIEEYNNNLSSLKNRILRDYERDLEQIENNDKDGIMIILPTQDSIRKSKNEQEEVESKIIGIEEKIQTLNTQISKDEGKLEEILKEIPESEKADLLSYESEGRYEEEIKAAEQLIQSYKNETKELNKKLDQNKEYYGKLNIQAEYYNSFIKREGDINGHITLSEAKDFRIFEDEYLNLKRIVMNLCEKWTNRIKTVQEETMNFIIREPLEQLGQIGQPMTAKECQRRRESFQEYIMNIIEQIEKISNDILQLENYQQDFTRRCIQRAELILGHLRKLETLSRIDVYGRRMNMIELKLQEFEDKEKQFRMKNHIDSIVREISESGMVDRKRVASKLSTKELLAQITDMDKAVVRLYKVESIPENSKYYRWENAIGSEGQNNSLYFIFAACLISFIRMLSITNTSLKTKKVIIADNPFGATSAVYLWDPMFKIMKQNDIQLIAPGHRIPREITSRFGVSYLLNQDILQDGRMRVVVKDVRVEGDKDLLRYIEPEQLSLL